LFGGTGEIVCVFSSPAADVNLDGFQSVVLHPQAELFVNFFEAVFLEAIAHARASVRSDNIAMLKAGYFRTGIAMAPARCRDALEKPGFLLDAKSVRHIIHSLFD
jgi:hypothetical protein